MSNRFEHAIKRGQLLAFAKGTGDYLTPDPDWGDHLVIRSYQAVIPLLSDPTRQDDAIHALILMYQLLLDDGSLPEDEKVNLLMQHLYAYHHFRSDKALFTRDLPARLNVRLVRYLKAHFVRSAMSDSDPLITTFKKIQALGGLHGIET